MSRAASPFTGRRYGVVRVTREWEMARSSFYYQRGIAAQPGRMLGRRGPKTAWSDAALLEKIRELLAASPFYGEGHRKVWARLRFEQVRTSKARVLRLMREAQLLAPSRMFPKAENPHTGTIITARPNEVWASDHTLTATVEEGAVTVFVAVDHCTTECVGLHAAKKATRFEALEPLRQGVRDYCGGFRAGAATGIRNRHDHGSQYLSDDYQAETRALQPALDRSAPGLPHASPGAPAVPCARSRCMNTLNSLSNKSGAKHERQEADRNSREPPPNQAPARILQAVRGGEGRVSAMVSDEPPSAVSEGMSKSVFRVTQYFVVIFFAWYGAQETAISLAAGKAPRGLLVGLVFASLMTFFLLIGRRAQTNRH